MKIMNVVTGETYKSYKAAAAHYGNPKLTRGIKRSVKGGGILWAFNGRWISVPSRPRSRKSVA